MTEEETRSVIVERELPFPPEKVWRALTTPHFIEEWLMKNDFRPQMGHQFSLSQEWGSIDCQVRAIEPHKLLSYSWVALGVETLVTFTLTPSNSGTHLRMEQAGFGVDQNQAYQGARLGWRGFLGKLEALLGTMD